LKTNAEKLLAMTMSRFGMFLQITTHILHAEVATVERTARRPRIGHDLTLHYFKNSALLMNDERESQIKKFNSQYSPQIV
jgi:hypothetical protein